MNCPNCGKEVAELTDRFCRNCREELKPLHTKCTECGFSAITPPEMGIRYCPMCASPWPQASTASCTAGKTAAP